jgi:hypothetical protein
MIDDKCLEFAHHKGQCLQGLLKTRSLYDLYLSSGNKEHGCFNGEGACRAFDSAIAPAMINRLE